MEKSLEWQEGGDEEGGNKKGGRSQHPHLAPLLEEWAKAIN